MDGSLSIVLILLVVGIPFVIFIVSPFSLWFQGLVSGASVGLLNIIFMRFRKVPPKMIVEALIISAKAGVQITSDQLEAHYLAGGNVMSVVHALVTASKAAIALSFERAAAIDLAGRNVLEAVQMAVNPKVIETKRLTAVTKDGVELSIIAQVTVRAIIGRLIGGAGEDTILAKVSEVIIATVASVEDHKTVKTHPEAISKRVLEKGVDSGTAMDILSVNIIEIKNN